MASNTKFGSNLTNITVPIWDVELMNTFMVGIRNGTDIKRTQLQKLQNTTDKYLKEKKLEIKKYGRPK